jgi:hypothetical protein
MDFRLTRQLRYYKKQDPPSDRVKPVPVSVLTHMLSVAARSTSPGNKAVADMITIAFFYLLRPGEYTATPSETTPFQIRNVNLRVGGYYIDIATASAATLRSATFASLTFDDQKNGTKGEVIALGRSGHPSLCPVRALADRIIHLRRHGANPQTPLSVYYENGAWHKVSPANITDVLRLAVTALGPQNLGFTTSDITARCLRAAGANALLCAGVDGDIIRLVGRWRSDEMLRYLHLQCEPVMRNFASRMLQGGNFVLHPMAGVPMATDFGAPQP